MWLLFWDFKVKEVQFSGYMVIGLGVTVGYVVIGLGLVGGYVVILTISSSTAGRSLK